MMEGQQRVRFRWDASRTLPAVGTFVPDHHAILDRAGDLQQEVFGPILHVVRWRANELDPLLDEIAANGYGLTLGIHTRIIRRSSTWLRGWQTGMSMSIAT